jgi:uncharacterized phage protein (TIGR01671 family)
MTREIKFRGFDRKKKEMIYGVGIIPGIAHAVRTKSFDFETMIAESEILNIHIEDIMQSIGHKDKNGKEIYQGDIIRRFDGAFRDGSLYEHGKPILVSDMKIDYSTYIDGKRRSFELILEVIGNVYENSKLLENLKEEAYDSN